MSSVKDLTEKRDALLLEAEIEQLQQAAKSFNVVDLSEAWGDVVDRREHLYDDTRFGSPISPTSLIDDRAEGQYRPVFENELDLAFIRGASQLIVSESPAAQNVQENLTNYVIHNGYSYTTQARDGQESPPALIDAAQKILDRFIDDNDWTGDLERELHERSREDGEFFLALKPDNGKTRACVVEPAQVTEPSNPAPLEDWLGVSQQFVSSWRFGVHTRLDDISRPLGYHVVYDGAGNDWDYLPASQVEHFKRNVRRNIKRGVSDYYSAYQFIQHAEKVLRNTSIGSAIQASIAYIREHAPGVSQSEVTTMRVGGATRTETRNWPAAQRTHYEQSIRAGRILDIPANQKYHAAPLGAAQVANFVQVIQAALRYTGVRWAMPEYLISGDASNNNFASALVAEAPFVKAREADQTFYSSRFKRVMWKVLKIAHDAGAFDRFRVDFFTLRRLVEIVVDTPDVATRNRMEDAQVKQIEQQAGILSLRTWATESGRDFDQEQQQKKEDGDKPPEGGGGDASAPPATGRAPVAESLFPDAPESLKPYSSELAELIESLKKKGKDLTDEEIEYLAALLEDCGTGDGGFEKGNKCGGASGAATRRKARKHAKTKAKQAEKAAKVAVAARKEKRKEFVKKAGEKAMTAIRVTGPIPAAAGKIAEAAGASKGVANAVTVAAFIGDTAVPGLPAGSAVAILATVAVKPKASIKGIKDQIKERKQKKAKKAKAKKEQNRKKRAVGQREKAQRKSTQQSRKRNRPR